MWGNVSLLMGTIGMAVVFAILLVTANAMMMSARERTGEVAVLKTIGFSDRRAVRAGDASRRRSSPLTGAVLGLGGGQAAVQAPPTSTPAASCPASTSPATTLLSGAGVALLLMLASGMVPACAAARLPVVQALRRVE